jgi:hypothetical protein
MSNVWNQELCKSWHISIQKCIAHLQYITLKKNNGKFHNNFLSHCHGFSWVNGIFALVIFFWLVFVIGVIINGFVFALTMYFSTQISHSESSIEGPVSSSCWSKVWRILTDSSLAFRLPHMVAPWMHSMTASHTDRHGRINVLFYHS